MAASMLWPRVAKTILRACEIPRLAAKDWLAALRADVLARLNLRREHPPDLLVRYAAIFLAR
jgi:hypothetical protein